MYQLPGNPRCPVASFRKYPSKLHPKCDALWQRPREDFLEEEPSWFCNMPIGKNPLGSVMKDISRAAHLSQIYTNHSVRATNITTLDDAGIEA